MNNLCKLVEIDLDRPASVLLLDLYSLANDDNECKVEGHKVTLRRLNKYGTFYKKRQAIGSGASDYTILSDYHIILMDCLGIATEVVLRTHQVRQALADCHWRERTELCFVNSMLIIFTSNYREISKYLTSIRTQAATAQIYVNKNNILYKQLDNVVNDCNRLIPECYSSIADPLVKYNSDSSQSVANNKFLHEAFFG